MLMGCSGMAVAPMALAQNAVANAVQPKSSMANIDACEYGVKADGKTDNFTAIQRIFDEVIPETGGLVQFPAGTCVCSGRIVSRAKPIIMLGAGCGSTIFMFTGETEDTVGFMFDQQNYPNTLQVRNLSLVTNQQETGDALTINYTPEDCMSMRVVERVFLENLTIVGKDIAQHGFRNGVVLRHVNSPFMLNVCVSGRQPAAGMENRTHTDACFKLIAGANGESMPVQAGLMKCSGYNSKFGVNLIGAHEGLVVTAGNFVECGVGISQNCGPGEGIFPELEDLPDGGIRPGIWVSDTHCNVFVAGVYLQDVVQGFIHDCLIYKAPDAVQDCSGIRLAHCADIKIHNSNFVSHTREGRFEGVHAEKNSSRCQVFNNTFTWTDASLHFERGTTRFHCWDNIAQGGMSGDVIDEGEKNFYRDLGKDNWRETETVS